MRFNDSWLPHFIAQHFENGVGLLRVLLLTFYFRPDLSAGAFRATALAEALRKTSNAIEIDIVTTMPNRYGTFSANATATEQTAGVNIKRIVLPAHRSGMLDQSLTYYAFSRQALKFVRNKHYDIIIATSSRLMTAVLGAWIASRKRTPLYLDIRDIFVDTIKDVLPNFTSLLIKPVLGVLERWAIMHASKVNLVSQGFADYFLERYPSQKYSYFTNGIDDEFLAALPKECEESKQSVPLQILYAGNIGEGQGLHAILPELGRRLSGQVHFQIIGDGGRKALLRSVLESSGVTNVELLPPMPRNKLIEAYRQADVLFLHLNDYDAFKKVLPSKIFEYAAMGKPIFAGISGYSAQFVSAEISNAVVFPPCDAGAAEQALKKLVIKDAPREAFVKKYSRENICGEMAKDILTLV